MIWYSVPCSHEVTSRRDISLSNFVMGLMLGDRRFPGATILGRRCSSTSSANHHYCQSRRRILYFVMGGPVDSVRDGVLPEG